MRGLEPVLNSQCVSPSHSVILRHFQDICLFRVLQPVITLLIMFTSRPLCMLPVTLYFAASVVAELKPYIPTVLEYSTECKTCPRSLCPNTIDYTDGDTFNVTCWTQGTKIMGDRLWLKNEAGCYITQYDVIEYAGDCDFCSFHLWRLC